MSRHEVERPAQRVQRVARATRGACGDGGLSPQCRRSGVALGASAQFGFGPVEISATLVQLPELPREVGRSRLAIDRRALGLGSLVEAPPAFQHRAERG